MIGCNTQQLPALYPSCHAVKLVLLPLGEPINASASVVPFQLFRVGNLAIVGQPWEMITIAGRRIHQAILNVLRQDGVDDVVINGLSNDCSSYLTTREEYAVQQLS